MLIKVEFFGSLRGVVGKRELRIAVKKRYTMGELLKYLKKEYPDLKKSEGMTIVFLNHCCFNAEDELKDGDEVLLLPAVGGG